MVFEQGNKKKSQGLRSGEYGGLGTFNRNAFFCQKFIDGDCRVTCGVVVVQHPSVCIAWSHKCHPFPESFKDFPIKICLTVCPGGTNSLWMIPLTVKKQMSINLILDLLILAFLGQGEFAVCHSRLWRFVSGVVLQNP